MNPFRIKLKVEEIAAKLEVPWYCIIIGNIDCHSSCVIQDNLSYQQHPGQHSIAVLQRVRGMMDLVYIRVPEKYCW